MVIFTCLSPAKGSWLSLRSLCGLFLVIRSKIVFKARFVVWAYNYIPLTVKTSQKRFCEVLQPAFKISFLLTQQFCKKLCSKYTCRKTPSFSIMKKTQPVSTMFLCNMKKMQVVSRSSLGVRFTGSSRLWFLKYHRWITVIFFTLHSRFIGENISCLSVVFFFVHSLFHHQFFTSLSSVSSLIPRLNHLWFTCGYNRLDFRIVETFSFFGCF